MVGAVAAAKVGREITSVVCFHPLSFGPVYQRRKSAPRDTPRSG